jgi:hypothetical protein
VSNFHHGFADALQILQDISVQPQSLYELWWSGTPQLIEKSEVTETNFHPELHSRRIQSSDREGNEIHTLGFAAVALRPGDFYNLNDQEAVIRRWATWSNSYWSWIQGVQIPLHPVDHWQLRLYVPTTQSPTVSVAQEIARELDENRMPFRLKFRQSRAPHSDSIVIWIERRHYPRVLTCLSSLLGGQTYLAKPPPLTLWRNSIGVCDHPNNGESVGWMYSEFLWQIVRSGSEPQLVPKLESRGINAQYPWRLHPEHDPRWDRELEI